MSWVFGKYREYGDGHLPQSVGTSLSMFTFICLGLFCFLAVLQLSESQRHTPSPSFRISFLSYPLHQQKTLIEKSVSLLLISLPQ